MIKKDDYREISRTELEILADLGGECFNNHKDIIDQAFGHFFRLRYHTDGKVEFINRKHGQWHLIGEEPNHIEYIDSALSADKKGCKGCKGL